MTIKVKMIPHLNDLTGESGIDTCVRKWFEHLPKYGIELAGNNDDSFDILAVHAGMSDKIPTDVPLALHLHGLYWSADYPASRWEWMANALIVNCIRSARTITVPSQWVARTFERDIRVHPHVVPHGVDMEEWSQPRRKGKYVIGYLKNRSYVDVCNPQFLTDLAIRFPDTKFLSTFEVPDNPKNVEVTGIIPHAKVADLLRDAIAVVSPIRETFGILTLEAMAAGIPVLGYDYGGNRDIIRHGETGYLARVNNIDDLAQGLEYCTQYRDVLGDNAREVARDYTWAKVCEQLAGIYRDAVVAQPATVSVVIPSYKYWEKVGRAIESVQAQTVPVNEIIVVDDGSPDDGKTAEVVQKYAASDPRVRYVRQENSGVAVARNHGISISTSKYIVCLDADDAIDPKFVQACLPALEKDPSLGIAYTKILAITPDGKQAVSQWPTGNWDFDAQIAKRNQVPTCCMFRREMWKRVGGYRQRYAPTGAGAEDAEFWLRCGAAGWKARMVTDAPLFIYSYMSGQVSGNRNYREVDWTSLHPYCTDGQHPLASYARPTNSRLSHPVRQYDTPTISVIIPVGPGHKSAVFNALDSLEAQTFRKWEVIIVDDTGDDEPWSFDGMTDMLTAYPYVTLVKTPGRKGAGYARNRGAEAARGSMLLFLDADDNLLSPDTLRAMLDTWNSTGYIVYTDYVNKSYIDAQAATIARRDGRLLDYDEKTGLAMTRSYASEYDCERACAQPKEPFYIWNLITSLLPKDWHDEIGGFDEKMESWEDWVYWLMLARAGKCFVRIPEPMIVYRFYTGSRRENGIQDAHNLIQYIVNKFEGATPMACGCSKKNPKATGGQNAPLVQKVGAVAMNIRDDELVLISYTNPNTGMHRVVGPSGQDYGYRSGGGVDKFYVRIADQRLRPDWFKIVEQQPKQTGEEHPVDEVKVAPPPPPKPKTNKRRG